jgi:hypothetical protein
MENLKNHFWSADDHSKGMVLSLNKVDIDSSSVNIISVCIEKRRKRYVILYYWKGKPEVNYLAH